MEEPDFPYPTQNSSRRAKWTVIIGVFLIAVITGISLLKQQPKRIEVEKVVAVEYKQLANSPTAKPVKEKKDITIQVLNGTGISGQAAKIVRTLEAEGYTPDNIKFGNAETNDHSITSITSNADLEEIVQNIIDALKPIVSEIAHGVPNPNPNIDSGFDVVIITGDPISNLTQKP